MGLEVARGGGHIAALRFPETVQDVNAYWTPRWTSLEPEDVTVAKVESEDGGPPEGRLLASILGYSLAPAPYGPPSPEEAAAGDVTHGQLGVLPLEVGTD